MFNRIYRMNILHTHVFSYFEWALLNDLGLFLLPNLKIASCRRLENISSMEFNGKKQTDATLNN